MTPDTWQRLSKLLDAVLEMPAPARQAALAELHQTDPELAREAEAMLQEADTQDAVGQAPSQWFTAITLADTLPTFTAAHGERYTIEREIARGGMGVIYRVRDVAFGRALAIKTLLPSALRVRTWFDREAQITGRLQHPGIPPVHERGTLADGTPFFAMKLIDGRTLAEVLHDPDWPTRALDVFEQVCRTLAYAHQQGVIHRDLKPANIMVGAFGEVQVMDWGLATILPTASGWDIPSMTTDGVVGTPAYMAPEQARGATLDERADVFGLGALLCAMLTKQPPYIGPALADILRDATTGNTTPALQRMADVGTDTELLALAKRCLASNPADRFRHAGELADAVSAYRSGMRERLRQAELAVVRHAEEKRRRRVWYMLLVVGLLLVVGSVGVWGWTERLHAQRVERATTLNNQIKQTLDTAASSRQALYDTLTNPKTAGNVLNDLQPWHAQLEQMRASLGHAKQLATSAPDVASPEFVTRLEQMETDWKADEADWLLANKVDQLRLDKLDQGYLRIPGAMEAAYEAAFRQHGWDILDGGDAVISELQHSPLQQIVVAILDDWAHTILTRTPRNEAALKRVLYVARSLDPEPWRAAWRQPHVWTDAKQVAAQCATLRVTEQPPSAVRVVALVRQHHRLPATDVLREALQQHADNFWLHYTQGYVAMNVDTVAALAANQAALALRPKNGSVLANLAVACGLRGDLTRAEDYLKQLLEVRPDSDLGLSNLAKCYYEQGRYHEAIAMSLRCLSVHPNNVFAHKNHGASLCALSEFAAGAEAYERGAASEPKDVGAQDSARKIRDVLSRQQKIVPHEQERLTLTTLAKGHQGTLTEQHPTDWFIGKEQSYRAGYQVELVAGTPYQVDLTADFDPFLRIETLAMKPLFVNDNRTKNVLASRLVFTPPTTGLYRLVVTSAKPNVTGAFTLYVNPTKVAKEAASKTGALTRATSFDQGHYYDQVPLRLTAYQPVRITLRSPAFHTLVRLFDIPGKVEFATNRWVHPYDKNWSQLDYTPTATGTYQLMVSTSLSDRLGAYTVEVEEYKLVPGPWDDVPPKK